MLSKDLTGQNVKIIETLGLIHTLRFFLIATAMLLSQQMVCTSSMEVFTLCHCDNITNSYTAQYRPCSAIFEIKSQSQIAQCKQALRWLHSWYKVTDSSIPIRGWLLSNDPSKMVDTKLQALLSAPVITSAYYIDSRDVHTASSNRSGLQIAQSNLPSISS